MHAKLTSAAVCCLCVTIALAACVTAEVHEHQHTPSSVLEVATAAMLSHRRTLKLVVEAEASYWFGKAKGTSSVTLVSANSLKQKKADDKEEEKEEKEVEEGKQDKQLHTDHLKEFELAKYLNLPKLHAKEAATVKLEKNVTSSAEGGVSKDKTSVQLGR